MAKANQQWKQAEREVAAIFGARRRPLSGGNQGQGRDDAIHAKLFVSTKYAKRHALWSLYRTEKPKAIKEGKTVVIGLREKSVPGTLVCIHSADLPAVLAAYMEANVDAANAILRNLGVNIELVEQETGGGGNQLPPKKKPKRRVSPLRKVATNGKKSVRKQTNGRSVKRTR